MKNHTNVVEYLSDVIRFSGGDGVLLVLNVYERGLIMGKIADDVYNLFESSLVAVGGGCVRTSKAELGKTIAGLFKEYGADSACLAESDLFKDAAVAAAMKDAGIETFTDHIRKHGETAIGGCSQAAFGIAELGTLVQADTDVRAREVAIMPDYYIGVVKGSTIKPTYDEMFMEMASWNEMPNFVGFITGPSRTADIECVATIGVHGPLKMTAVVVDDE